MPASVQYCHADAADIDAELFGAVVLRAALLDMFRNEAAGDGAITAVEFGSVSTQQGFETLSMADVYNRITDQTAYPSVLLTAGLNDTRVPAWHAAKTAARLQHATASGRPVLLRVEGEGGHLWFNQADPNAEHADVYAFLLDQLR